MKRIILAIFLFARSNAQDLPKFVGRAVTVVDPGTVDKDGFDPKGPASICIEGPPQRQCYTAPDDYGRSPSVELVQVKKGMPALLFSAASGGVSGFLIHFALLQPGTGKDLEKLFMSDTTVSEQSQHEFWNDPTISAARIFTTADYVWGPGEAHQDSHRYIISSYVLKHVPDLGGSFYYLEDRYMTAHQYDLDASGPVLSAEKQEIIRRLRRLKIDAKPQH